MGEQERIVAECRWEPPESDQLLWHSDCGVYWFLGGDGHGVPSDYDFSFCPGCGRKLATGPAPAGGTEGSEKG